MKLVKWLQEKSKDIGNASLPIRILIMSSPDWDKGPVRCAPAWFEVKFQARFIMKRFAAVGAICAAFLLGGAISALAQEEHRDEKEVRHEERHDQHEEKREEHIRRIQDDHFRAHFGREHHFAIRHVVMVGGRPHFAYGGYNFEIVQPWPGGWAYSDNCYIDFVDGGYYLFNLRHPGVRVAVAVLP
jgi:hypothetical protein